MTHPAQQYKDLNSFLKAHKRVEGGDFTHTSLGDPKNGIYPGSYNIPLNESDTFLALYYNHVFQQKKSAFLTEKHIEYSPIVIDLDFRFKGNLPRQYTEEDIKYFINIYIGELSNILDNVNDKRATAFVMEKSKERYLEDKDITKDGLHIIFPYLVTKPDVQYTARYKTILNPKTKELFKKMNVSNPVDDIFDKCVISTNNWQMYGSMKPGGEPYKLTKVICNYENIPLSSFKRHELLRLLSVRNFSNSNKYTLSDEENANIDTILNSIPSKHKTKKNTIKIKKARSPKNKKTASDDEYLIAKELINILSSERADSFESWIRVGWCLHNIDYRLLTEWINFSKKSSKYREGECEREWTYMDSDGLSIGSLCRWAKEDNGTEYNKIMNNNIYNIMQSSVSGTQYDVAKVVFAMFRYEFKCVSISKRHWYQFKEHRWRHIDDAVVLRKYFSTKVIDKYLKFRAEVSQKAAELDSSDPNKEIYLDMGDKVNKIINSLKKTTFKRSLLEECGELFYDNEFEEKLDANVNLIGFENGVYDLENGEFREGLADDYISFTTGIYYETFKEDDQEIIDVKKFLSEVFTEEPVRKYMFRLISSFLSGKTGAEKFYIWTGCGGNGKSKIIELFRNGFKDYCATLPVSIITQKRARAESASPAMAGMRGKRFVTLQEAEGDEQINVALMKELTGGDLIKARKLHQDFFEFKPQFKPVLTCNVLPEVNANDRGTWRRMRVVDFTSVFTANPNPNNKKEFLIDEELDEKLVIWKEAFMYMLLEEYKKYKLEGIIEPDEVMKTTESYQYDNDNYSQFFNEKIIEVKDINNEGITLHEIYTVYKSWFLEEKGTNQVVPKKKDLKNSLIKVYGKPKNNTWISLSFKNFIKDSEEEDDDYSEL